MDYEKLTQEIEAAEFAISEGDMEKAAAALRRVAVAGGLRPLKPPPESRLRTYLVRMRARIYWKLYDLAANFHARQVEVRARWASFDAADNILQFNRRMKPVRGEYSGAAVSFPPREKLCQPCLRESLERPAVVYVDDVGLCRRHYNKSRAQLEA